MDEMKSLNKVSEIITQGSKFQIKTVDDFNVGLTHILQLIDDAYTLYAKGSYASATFIAITVIEEVAKIHLGLYTADLAPSSKRDPLRKDHAAKHIIGSNYTISMGKRLADAIGVDQIDRIFQAAYSGNLKNLRECSLYCDCENGRLRIPCERITKWQARALLLFAIESFDDNLVGYTDFSIERSKWTDELFATIAKDRNE